MHRSLSVFSVALFAGAFLVLLQPARAAFDVDFVNGIWDHSGFGGPPSSSGWSSGILGGEIDPGDGLHATFTYGFTGTGFGGSITGAAAVPEPSGALFLSSAALCAVMRRARRRAHRRP